MEIFAITGKPLSVCESKKYMQIGRTRHVRACFTDNRITLETERDNGKKLIKLGLF